MLLGHFVFLNYQILTYSDWVWGPPSICGLLRFFCSFDIYLHCNNLVSGDAIGKQGYNRSQRVQPRIDSIAGCWWTTDSIPCGELHTLLLRAEDSAF